MKTDISSQGLHQDAKNAGIWLDSNRRGPRRGFWW